MKKDSTNVLKDMMEKFSINSKLMENKIASLNKNIEANNKHLENIMLYCPDGIIFISQNGVILLLNPAATQITTYSSLEALGSNFYDLFPDSCFGFSMRELLSKGKCIKKALVTVKFNTAIKDIEVSAIPIPNQGVLLFLKDLTDSKKLEQSLRSNERLSELGQMAATLAHEIRNPLGGIEGFASLLKHEIKDEKQSQMVQFIIDGTRSLNNLVNNILNYTRPFRLYFTLTNLADLLKETVNIFSADPLIQNRINLALKTTTAIASLDKEHFKCALLNLIRNAIEASNPKDSITILLHKNGNISVCDHGYGISKEQINEIFTPFFTTKSSGNGLGLARAYQIIKAHGWDISVKSIKNVETIFTITLFGECS